MNKQQFNKKIKHDRSHLLQILKIKCSKAFGKLEEDEIYHIEKVFKFERPIWYEDTPFNKNYNNEK